MQAFATEVYIKRRIRDGWYVYTSDMVPGLLVASKDDRRAYDDVPVAIKLLFKLDFNVEVSVANKLGYDEFMARVTLGDRAREAVTERTSDMMGDFTMIPFVLGSKEDRFHQ